LVDAYEAIVTRRSVPKTSDKPVDRITVTRLLEAGIRAPCHFLTQPWRFIVLTGDARVELGEAWAVGARREGTDPEAAAQKALRAPVIIAVVERPKAHHKKVVLEEEHYAVGAVIQNILLAAHAEGLGAMIRTGEAPRLPEVRAHLEVKDDEIIAALIYVGYPLEGEQERPLTRRAPVDEVTEWRGW
jgi:nitroreductase